jgi:hypothetical protein
MGFSKVSFDATGNGTVAAFETVNNLPSAVQTFGVSVTGIRCGVYGESSKSPVGTRPSLEIAPERTGVAGRGDEAGVRGSGRVGVVGVGSETGVFGTVEDSTDGTGVRGESIRGDGVFGSSQDRRGGVFESGRSAQVQLMPQRLGPLPRPTIKSVKMIPTKSGSGPALPKNALGGDLMCVVDNQRQCTLWFCAIGSDGTSIAQWAQVLLGESFAGRK